MRLNPVFVLAILVVGEYLFGLWGLLLGVPVAVTLLRRTRDIVRSDPMPRSDDPAAGMSPPQ